MSDAIEDSALVDELRNKATRNLAFHKLVKLYQQRVYWLVRRLVVDHDDANDIVQDVFIKVWNNIDQYKGESELFTWIYRIASNDCFTFLNKKKKRFFISWQDTTENLANQLESDALFDGDEAEMLFKKAVLSLPEKQQLVFNLKYFDELKYSQIAAITGTSEGALKASYHHAVKKIEQFITAH